MKKLITRLLADERFRFLIVGGINTVVGYGLFVLFYYLIGQWVGYLGSLYISYVISTVIAFILHRRFTFQVVGTGSVVVDFLRFAGVYVVSLAINSIVLPLLVEFAHFNPLAAQAITVIITTLISYAGHKYFSFRRGKGEESERAPSAR